MKKKLYACFLILISLAIASCDRSNKTEGVFIQSDSNACEEQKIPNEFIVKWKSGKITKINNMNQNYFVNTFLQENLGEIEKSEPNYKLRLKPRSLSTLNSCGSSQWHLNETSPQLFWNKEHFGEGITIAITDSGLDLNNEQLLQSIALNPGENGLDDEGNDKSENGIDDDGNGYIDDSVGLDLIENDTLPDDNFGHGTAVASTIIYDGQDDIKSVDLRGVAPKVKIIPIKFIDDENGSTETAIKAIQYAVSRKADIINASWGGHDCSSIMPDFLQTIEQEETLFVVAAGNGHPLQGFGLDIDNLTSLPPIYPASTNLKNQITVGSISLASKKRSSFSNYGVNSVELFAPGDDILTLGLDSTVQCIKGTSFSAPIVAGALALIMNAYPDRNHLQIKQTLLDHTRKDESYKNLTSGSLSLENILDEDSDSE